ncbi:MAG: hypothetical protein G01um101431_318 [Parcubacteria group bacterium Gr01-1014_31]|nr:MAG: hypothetical protein G01um101431_318 [Parcubacteria group bacterium Gr01-1014_31]
METEFCKFLGSANADGSITMRPLGYAKNSVDKPTLPGWKDVVTDIVINEEYAKGLDGIEEYSHIMVVYWLDKEKHCHLRHHPQGRADVPFGGIFACRCPQRPNPIALSTVELVGRVGNILKVKGLDILNDTPVVDIKPYWPQYDKVENPRVPSWVDKLVF